MRVLVVEDEPELLRVVAQALREAGYAVDEAGGGEEGLYKATSWDYDAVVLDLMLPGRDGWEVLAGLRQKRKTPVLILTARDGVAYRVRGLDAGADATSSSRSRWRSFWPVCGRSFAARLGRPSRSSCWGMSGWTPGPGV